MNLRNPSPKNCGFPGIIESPVVRPQHLKTLFLGFLSDPIVWESGEFPMKNPTNGAKSRFSGNYSD
jgi:hypothetical protein